MPKQTKEETYTNRHHESNEKKKEVFAKAHEEYAEVKKEEKAKKLAEQLKDLHLK